MAREARKLSKSGNYYVVLKGSELFTAAEDKKQFTEILERNFATGIVHGYELTKDEIRLVVKEGEKGISMTMKSVATSYARYYNRAHDREGKLFEGRFRSEPLETKEEIEECLKNLKSGKKEKKEKKTETKRKTVKKETAKKSAAKKEEIKKTEILKEETERKKQPPQKKNLPTWLL